MEKALGNLLLISATLVVPGLIGLSGATSASPVRATPVPTVVATPTASPGALDGVKPGLWTLTPDEPGAVPQRLCVGDPAMLIQVQHAGVPCSRLVIADSGHGATIHYSCPGAGWGRTSLRVVSATDVSIDTQGIAANAPFAYRATARREGECHR